MLAREIWLKAGKGRFFFVRLSQPSNDLVRCALHFLLLITHRHAAPRHKHLLDSISTTALSKLSLPATRWHMDAEGQYVLPT